MLKNLEGISATKIDADSIRLGKDIKPILDKGIAATAAGDSGALNIWKDDDGWIRCEAMRFRNPIDKKIFDNMEDVEKWADKWLPDIGVFPYEDIEIMTTEEREAKSAQWRTDNLGKNVGLSNVSDCADLKHELEVTDKLLNERQRVLDAIPECPSHGKCVPHAIEWIEEMKTKHCC